MTPQQAVLCLAGGLALLRLSRRPEPPTPENAHRSRECPPPRRVAARSLACRPSPAALAGRSQGFDRGDSPAGRLWLRIAALSGWALLLLREAWAGGLLPRWAAGTALCLAAVAVAALILGQLVGKKAMPASVLDDAVDGAIDREVSHVPLDPALRPDFSGVWMKDHEASSSMEEAIQEMKLNALVRTAIRLVRGVEIKQSDEVFQFGMFSVIAWFKVTEKYPFNGDERKFQRRDLRKGKHVGAIEWTVEGWVRLTLSWEEPFAGWGTDHFKLTSANEMHVTSTMHREGRQIEFNTVYRRKS